MSDRGSPEQRRIGARGAAIAGGYLLYLVLDRSHATFASALVGLGVILVTLALIDVALLPERDRSSKNLAAFLIGGIAALAVGLALVLL